MRTFIAIIVVLGVVVILGRVQTVAPSPQSIKADSIEFVNGIYQLRGNVHIGVGQVSLRADEADLSGREITVRGDVRIHLPEMISAVASR